MVSGAGRFAREDRAFGRRLAQPRIDNLSWPRHWSERVHFVDRRQSRNSTAGKPEATTLRHAGLAQPTELVSLGAVTPIHMWGSRGAVGRDGELGIVNQDKVRQALGWATY